MESSQHTQNYQKYCQAVDVYEKYEWVIEGVLLLAVGQLGRKLCTNMTAKNAFLVSTGSFIALRVAHYPVDHRDNYLKKRVCHWGAFLVLGGVSYPFLKTYAPTVQKNIYHLGIGMLLTKTVSLTAAAFFVRRHFDVPDTFDERAKSPELLDRFYTHFLHDCNDWKSRSYLFQIQFLTLCEANGCDDSMGSIFLRINSNGKKLEKDDTKELSDKEVNYLTNNVFCMVSDTVKTVDDYLGNIPLGLREAIPSLYKRALTIREDINDTWFCKAAKELKS